MSYVEKCKQFVKENGYITHQDILEITDTNCSYSVMQSLKKIFLFEEIPQKSMVVHCFLWDNFLSFKDLFKHF